MSGKIYAVEADDLEAYQKSIAPYLFFPKQKFYYESSEIWIAMDILKKNYLADKITEKNSSRR